jgi:signal transduction histidine kinase
LVLLSGQRLLDTINAVLEATRLDQHTLLPAFTTVNLAPAIESVVKRMQPLVKGGDVILSATTGPQLKVKADAAFLERILNNLIGNATKFTQKGTITVSWEEEGENAVVHIADTGIGIASSFLRTAFDEFTQESSGPTRSHDGSGLGLSIVKKLLEMMDGSISVSSIKDKGSTFTFRLPLVPN